MKQEYFVVVLAHSLRGRLRRIQIPHQAVYAILLLALFGCFSVVGFISSYARMAWKVANYNALKSEADGLRARYQNLQRVVNQTNEQLASLQLYANEISIAYGIKQKLEGPADIAAEGRLVPTFAESVAEYNFLRTTNALALPSAFARRRAYLNPRPGIWPVNGTLRGGFGERTDPFSGEGAFHKGVDISAPIGTPVRATADGLVVHADLSSGYGRMVVIDHGNGLETCYAHLSRFYVRAGQEVRMGEVVGAVGTSGRVTAPHLHYEVHVGSAPMNPYRYLAHTTPFQEASRKDFPF